MRLRFRFLIALLLLAASTALRAGGAAQLQQPVTADRTGVVAAGATAGSATAGATIAAAPSAGPVVPPPVPREFRGVWVATVYNIDWPSKAGLPSQTQQAELLAILDMAVRLRLNAVILQVRPAADALYQSEREPWSQFLSGQSGIAPQPPYDPLSFAVAQAHARGLELHAWFNPYRAGSTAKTDYPAHHISRARPELVRSYGKHLWLDPGEEEVRKHSLGVILDVVRRYDVDAVHLDDYFYPYQEKDETGKVIPFPDDASWQKYLNAGGTLSRDDWRRDNVNGFVRRLYDGVKASKRWVKVGISPFGIWRPGSPASVKGLDAYATLYADARLWLRNGWVDYFTPQLYWRIDAPEQSYPDLLGWWMAQNTRGRHMWIGNSLGRLGTAPNNWAASEITDQIAVTRAQPGAMGNVFFSAKVLMQNKLGVADALVAGPYAQPALVPATPWLDALPPPSPRLQARKDNQTGTLQLTWTPGGAARLPEAQRAWRWVVQTRSGEQWNYQLLDGTQNSLSIVAAAGALPDAVAVSAVDRTGNQSAPAVMTIPVAR